MSDKLNTASNENDFLEDQSRRFACNRCRGQKLRCERTPTGAPWNKTPCRRCVKARACCVTSHRQRVAKPNDSNNKAKTSQDARERRLSNLRDLGDDDLEMLQQVISARSKQRENGGGRQQFSLISSQISPSISQSLFEIDGTLGQNGFVGLDNESLSRTYIQSPVHNEPSNTGISTAPDSRASFGQALDGGAGPAHQSFAHSTTEEFDIDNFLSTSASWPPDLEGKDKPAVGDDTAAIYLQSQSMGKVGERKTPSHCYNDQNHPSEKPGEGTDQSAPSFTQEQVRQELFKLLHDLTQFQVGTEQDGAEKSKHPSQTMGTLLHHSEKFHELLCRFACSLNGLDQSSIPNAISSTSSDSDSEDDPISPSAPASIGEEQNASTIIPSSTLDMPTTLAVITAFTGLIRAYEWLFEHLHRSLLTYPSAPGNLLVTLRGLQIDGFSLDEHQGLQIQIAARVFLHLLTRMEAKLKWTCLDSLEASGSTNLFDMVVGNGNQKGGKGRLKALKQLMKTVIRMTKDMEVAQKQGVSYGSVAKFPMSTRSSAFL
jgi:hypothetical protein